MRLPSELVEYFRAQMGKDPEMASAVAAIRTLLEYLKRDKGLFILTLFAVCQILTEAGVLSGETILGLRESLMAATDCLTGVDSSVAVSSAGELFLRFISLTSLEHQVSPSQNTLTAGFGLIRGTLKQIKLSCKNTVVLE